MQAFAYHGTESMRMTQEIATGPASLLYTVGTSKSPETGHYTDSGCVTFDSFRDAAGFIDAGKPEDWPKGFRGPLHRYQAWRRANPWAQRGRAEA